MFSKTTIAPTHTVQLVKDPNGAPAVDLAKVRESGHVDLAKRADKAGLALSKRGLAGVRAQAMLVLDHSGSMYDDYESGAVQKLVERALGFALQIDTDGSVPVIPFDSWVLPTVDVTIGNYADVVTRSIWQPARMGLTNMAAAFEVVKTAAATSAQPIFCIVVCDGSPYGERDSEAKTTKVVCELAGYPVFIKFLAVRSVPYLQTLDNLERTQPGRRLLDNVDTKYSNAELDLLTCTDLQFAEAMADEWDTWIAAATAAGVLAATA